MNPKAEKWKAEIEKNEEKIRILQERNRALQDRITETENLEIIGTVRESGITPEKLAELISVLREKPLAAAAGCLERTEDGR